MLELSQEEIDFLITSYKVIGVLNPGHRIDNPSESILRTYEQVKNLYQARLITHCSLSQGNSRFAWGLTEEGVKVLRERGYI